MKSTKRPLVFVGMSGGVDSSVAALLLKRRDYDVVGVFIKVWDLKSCTWREDRRDAMRVAVRLEIPLLTLDLSEEYKRGVVDYMIREYKSGRTPNPDVRCNREIKFGAFLNWAKAKGADYIATGHYARLQSRPTSDLQLLTSKDQDKDQTYFLWTLGQDELKHCLFPIGQYLKSETRTLARKFKLPTAEKKDSQGLCFIGRLNFKEFLAEFLPKTTGEVLNTEGQVIGQHDGAAFYTIGERHGFTIIKKTAIDEPYYVIEKDVKKNTLIVSQKIIKNIKHRMFDIENPEVHLEPVNWISGETPKLATYSARSRYRQALEPVKILDTKSNTAKVRFHQPQSYLAPGQSLVLYDGPICLGGGVIDKIEN